MAKFTVGLPDGRQVDINAPDGATQADAEAFALQEYNRGAYDSFSSQQVEQQTEQQQPENWRDVPAMAVTNIPESGKRLAGHLYEAVTSPVQTADAITKIGAGALQLLLPESVVNAIGKDEESINMARQVGQFFVDRYGTEQDIMNTIAQDPVGAAADVASVLTGLGGAARMTGSATRIPAVSKAGQAVEFTGKLVDPVMQTFNALKLAPKAPAAILGVTSGVGTNTIVEAFKAAAMGGERGAKFREALRGQVDVTTIVDEAQQALASLRDKAHEAYKADMQAVKGDRAVLAFDDIDAALTNATNTYGQFGGKVKSQKAVDTINAIMQKVEDWRKGDPDIFHTAYGLDQLKQAIWDNIEPLQKGSASANRTAEMAGMTIYDAIKGTISKQAPNYADTMKAYAAAQDEINMITKELSLGRGAMPDTSLRKLMSILRDNVNTNYGARRKRVDVLEGEGATLIPQIAGAELNPLAPRGAARFSGGGLGVGTGILTQDPVTTGAVLASASPRLIGESANVLGMAARPFTAAGQKVSQYTPATVRGAVGAVAPTLFEIATDPRALSAILQQQRAREEQR